MMVPTYYSKGKKEREYLLLSFLSNKKAYWLFSLFLLNLNLAQAQVVISEVFDDNSFELKNTGTDEIDISSYWICNFPVYRQLSGLTVACGNLNLAANKTVVIAANFDIPTDDAELGLYVSNSGGFGNQANIIAYLEWGATGHQRSGIATAKGIWDGNAVAAFSNGQSLELTGDGVGASNWTTNANPQKCAVAPPPASTSTARYQVTFNAAWSAATHPTDFPSSAHFTGLIGLTHTSNTALFELNGMASQGIISMAETGSKTPLTAEIQTIIDGGQGQTLVSGGSIGVSPGSVAVEFGIENSHPLVSITTMIAPSPDWFVGVKDLNLFENGDWVSSKTIEVNNYDSGSDDGVSFTSPNSPTSPQGIITMITDGPLLVNGTIPSMGTMTFTRIDAGACVVEGGMLAGDPFTFCVDGVADTIPADGITLSGNTGTKSQWVVTDEQGKILGLPPSFSAPNFDAAGVGVCNMYHLSYEDTIIGLAADSNIAQLMGCFDLSNAIAVTRQVCEDSCMVTGGMLAGSPFTFCVDGVADTIPADGIMLSGNTGEKSQWVVTDEQGKILGLPPSFTAPNFDAAGVGVCNVYHLSYEDSIIGLAADSNIAQLMGCYDLSNAIAVTRQVCEDSCMVSGGTLTSEGFTFCVDGVADTIPADGITLSGNTGTKSQWVVTDEQGKILGLPPSFSAPNFDAAGVGVCNVYHLSYEDTIIGLAADSNIAQLMGCYDLSNAIAVTRQVCEDSCMVSGGTLTSEGFTFCVDGVADTIPADGITLSGNTGTKSQWVVTDEQGKILGLPPSFSAPNFDEAGVGVCNVYHLSYEDSIIGLAADSNIAQLMGCFALSNAIAVTRQVCEDSCMVSGGTLTSEGFTFCVDGVADTIPADGITLSGNTGEKSQWVVTDEQGKILGLPPSFSAPDFDAAGVGVCNVYHLSYEDSIIGLATDSNIAQLMGCYDLSNAIAVTRQVCEDSCMVSGGTLTSEGFTFCVDGVADTIPADGIMLSGNTGTKSQWVVTDEQGMILGLPPSFSAPNFDAAGVGVCNVYHLSYEDSIIGLAADSNIAQLMGCFDLSNAIAVTRQVCEDSCMVSGGTLTSEGFTFCVDGVADTIPADGITLSGNTGEKSQWVVTDEQGKILGLPPSFTAPNFDAAGVGVCNVYHLSYEDSIIGLAADSNIAQLMGCFDLSNAIAVTRQVCEDSCMVSGGTLTSEGFTFCVDGVADTIPADGIMLSGNTGTKSQWVVTDEQGKILGLPPSFTAPNFDAAGVGVCNVYHLSYEDSIIGLAADSNIAQLMGCFALSNAIAVTRQVCEDSCMVSGGTLTSEGFTFCVDGVADTIPADGITLSGNTGEKSQWVVTDEQGKILGLPPSFTAPNFDAAGVGVCNVYHLSYEDSIIGLAADSNIAQLMGCFALSNAIAVTRQVCEDSCMVSGGTLTSEGFTFCVDSVADTIPADGITLSGNTGAKSQWVVTDEQGKILGLPPSFSAPNFDAAGVGVCNVYHLSYEDGLVGLTTDSNIAQLMGCFALSNAIAVTRGTGEECDGVEMECIAPSEVVVEVLSSRKIRVDWEDVSSAAKYLIEIRFAGRTRIVGRGLIRSSRVHIFAPSGKDYEFQIKTICQDGSESPFTDWISFSTPENLVAIAESRNSETFVADISITGTNTKELAVFPNPVSDLLNLNYTLTGETATVELFHISGKKVAAKTLSNTTNNHQLDMSNYANGLYLITITEKGVAPITKRIVKGSLR